MMLETLKAKLAGARKSLTIWFNAAAATALGVLPMLQDSLPAIQQYAPGIKWFAISVIVGNVLLRFKTATGLESK